MVKSARSKCQDGSSGQSESSINSKITASKSRRTSGSRSHWISLSLLLLSSLSILLLSLPLSQATTSNFSPSLLWGTYRPQIYFGLRARVPNSLLTGLAWYNPQSYAGLSNLRHECDDADRLKGVDYTYHDGRSFAEQIIIDSENNYRLKTSWFKPLDAETQAGSTWAARIEGEVLNKALPAALSPIFYLSLESGFLTLDNEEDESGIPGKETINFSGSTPDMGEFNLRIQEADLNEYNRDGKHYDDFRDTVGRTSFLGAQIPPGSGWQAKKILQGELSTAARPVIEEYQTDDLPSPSYVLQLSNEVASSSNFFAIQKSFVGNFSFDIFYETDSTSGGSKLSSSGLTAALSHSKTSYDERFESNFGLQGKGFSQELIEFAKTMTSSVVGGIGYYYGQSIVDRSFTHEYDEGNTGRGSYDVDEDRRIPDPRLTEETGLFTGTPSRSMFPRGFYWDEGFHLAHIGAWDNDLSLEILQSWIDLIDEDGWVAREQILGEEARSRVPKEFQTQYPLYANPPTLIMAVNMFMDRLSSGNNFESDPTMQSIFVSDSDPSSQYASKHLKDLESAEKFLAEIYPHLRRHYLWFRRTQRGEITEWDREATSKGEAYRWRGRTKDHVLTSGLDDYPRAKEPHSGELHLDLMSWMGGFAKMMGKVAERIGEVDDLEEYGRHEERIKANLEDLHWSEKDNMYCDLTVDGQDEESVHVCHRGYISLFPFLLSLLDPSSPHLGSILDLLSDPDHLWSDFGIRSLSTKDEHFGKGENYWRGPVWMPMNYLTLGALKKTYAAQPGPYQAKAQKIYDQLRDNLIKNVHKEHKRTGYAWEQYNPVTGEGQRSKPFTGWTSLVALIMAEIY